MIKLYNLILIIICTVIGCREEEQKADNNKTSIDTITEIVTKNPVLKINPPKTLEYIIFGRFCAECGGECATMYKLNLLTNKLFVDHTDCYWQKEKTPIQFTTKIKNEEKFKIAKQITDSIPELIYLTDKSSLTFGCPDCGDACGFYLEVKQDKIIKQFYIDTQLEQLPENLKSFQSF